MSESDSQTPNSSRRRREEKEAYKARKKKILDIVLRELRISCVTHSTSRKELPSRKSQKLFREIQGGDGNDAQILSMLEGEIARDQRETVELMKNGLG